MSSSEESDALAENQDHVDSHRELARRAQIGAFLQREMERKGLTQSELARAAGCDQTTISKIIKGKQRASQAMLKKLLQALGLKPNALDDLPSTVFDPGSVGFRLRALIIRAVLEHVAPDDADVCARWYISEFWDDIEWREIARSPNLEDAVWASLIHDGYFEYEEGRYRVVYQMKGQLRYFLTSYLSHACSALHRLALGRDGDPAEALQEVITGIDAMDDALAHPEKLTDAINYVNLALARHDRLIDCILTGYSAGFAFYLQAATGATYAAEAYEKNAKSLMACIVGLLRQAVTDLQAVVPKSEWHKLVDKYVETLDAELADWAIHQKSLPGAPQDPALASDAEGAQSSEEGEQHAEG